MSEVTRDVTIRVNIAGGKIDRLPDFDKAATAADTFFKRVNSGFEEWQEQSSRAVGSTLAVVDQLKAVGQINIAPAGLENLEHAVEAIAVKQQQASEAASSSAATQTAASESVEEAQNEVTQSLFKTIQLRERLAIVTKEKAQEEKQAAADAILKEIQLRERLGAYQRAATEEAKKQETEKSEAAKKAGDETQKQLLQTASALAQSLAAGTQFIATLKVLGGNSNELDELAKNFAEMQTLIQGVSAATQGFNSVNSGLTSLQASAAAATSQLTLTGGAATLTQGALIRLAPAAAAAQAALGPIAIAVAGISLAVAAAHAVSKLWGDGTKEAAERAEAAYEKVNRQLDEVRRRMDAVHAAQESQNNALRAELNLRQALEGRVTSKDVTDVLNLSIGSATSGANAAIGGVQTDRAKEMAALSKRLDEISKERASLYKGPVYALYGHTDETRQKDRSLYDEERSLREQHTKLAENAVAVELTPQTMSEFADAVAALPEDARPKYEQVLAEYQTRLAESLAAAITDLRASDSDESGKLRDLDSREEQLRRQYEADQNTALSLRADPTRRQQITTEVDAAANAGNMNAAIDSLAGVVSTETAQSLRNKLAAGKLGLDDLKSAIDDATEFETEAAELAEQLATLKKQRDEIDSTKREISAALKDVTAKQEQFTDELRQIRAAAQAR